MMSPGRSMGASQGDRFGSSAKHFISQWEKTQSDPLPNHRFAYQKETAMRKIKQGNQSKGLQVSDVLRVISTGQTAQGGDHSTVAF